MVAVASGDRVQILCASHLDDGTELDNATTRAAPYWVKAGQSKGYGPISEALVGMLIGERKTTRFGSAAVAHAKRPVTLEFEVLAIRKAAG